MIVMGPRKFFNELPLRLTQYDLYSLSYAQDSRSYLIQIMQQNIKKADMVFFIDYFMPIIKELK
jgi:hypothetical protein